MKKAGALILTVIWGLLMVQPVFGSFTNGAIKPTCLKKTEAKTTCKKTQPRKSSCSKPKKRTSSCTPSPCSKPKAGEEKKGCEEERCNPLMSCPAGNFFLFSHTQIAFHSFEPAKAKTRLVNDNRLSKQLTECFHPPELI